MNKDHFKNIINGYRSAPINQIFKPKMKIGLGKCEIEMEISEQLHHSANSLHGSVYFKMLDDAAWGASNSYVEDVFLFTHNFNIYLTRPVSSGVIRAVGQVVNQENGKINADSTLYDSGKNEIGRGSGIFMRSKYLLTNAIGFNAK